MRNILITTLTEPPARKEVSFFYDSSETVPKYCDAIMDIESGTKQLLSQEHIDEILIIGSNASFDEGDERKSMQLANSIDYLSVDIDQMSSYSLFRYRISQFITETNIDSADWNTAISPERQKSLKIIIDNYFKNEFSPAEGLKKFRRFFRDLDCQPKELYELKHLCKVDSFNANADDVAEWNWILWYLYSSLSEGFKMTPRPDNELVEVCLYPISSNDTLGTDLNLVMNLILNINASSTEEVNIYIDTTGGDKSNNYILMNFINIFTSHSSSTNIKVRKIISSKTTKTAIAYGICNDTEEYSISELISAMDAFVYYGKANLMAKFFEKHNFNDPIINELLVGMKMIEEGITLIDIISLKKGFEKLQYLFSNSMDNAPNIIKIIEKTIRKDYGGLIEGNYRNPLELTKWAYRKEFFQQTLTIIEANMPKYLVEKGIFYYAQTDEDIEYTKEILNVQYYMKKPYERWQVAGDIAHYFYKYEGITEYKHANTPGESSWNFASYRIERINNHTDGALKTYTNCTDIDAVKNVIFAYNNLGPIRNRTNHAEEKSEDWAIYHKGSGHSKIYQDITQAIEYFFEALEKAESCLDESAMAPKVLDEEEFLAYTRQNKIEKKNSQD